MLIKGMKIFAPLSSIYTLVGENYVKMTTQCSQGKDCRIPSPLQSLDRKY